MDSELRAIVLRMEGTNCEMESKIALEKVGFNAKYVHLKKLSPTVLEESHMLMLPGGFSAGDYVRAGAIFAARLKKHIKSLRKFVEEGKAILGVCNGFQILVELGLLPGFDVVDERPLACLAGNESNRFECRWTYVKKENSVCKFTEFMSEVVPLPVAHAEGRFLCEEDVLAEIIDRDMVVFRYVDERGRYASYPWNPNGSMYNIAGITNPKGNVLGMMPHPERAVYPNHRPDYYSTHRKTEGLKLFQGIYEYVRARF